MSVPKQQSSMLPEEVPFTIDGAPARFESSCRSCRSPIWMLPNDATGKHAPVDRTPAQDGNVVLVDHGDADRAQIRYHVLSAHEFSYAPRFTNHFQTCPKPESFGGKRRR